MLGTNYRMTEIQAAIGIVQLRRLPEFLEKRNQNASKMTQNLSRSDKIILPPNLTNRKPSWYLYTVRIKNATEEKRKKIIEQMREKGIGTDAYYQTAINQMPYYKENFGAFSLPETEKAAKQVISLPIHPGVKQEQIDFIAKNFLDLLR
jgi:perosamine synthetase